MQTRKALDPDATANRVASPPIGVRGTPQVRRSLLKITGGRRLKTVLFWIPHDSSATSPNSASSSSPWVLQQLSHGENEGKGWGKWRPGEDAWVLFQNEEISPVRVHLVMQCFSFTSVSFSLFFLFFPRFSGDVEHSCARLLCTSSLPPPPGISLELTPRDALPHLHHSFLFDESDRMTSVATDAKPPCKSFPLILSGLPGSSSSRH